MSRRSYLSVIRRPEELAWSMKAPDHSTVTLFAKFLGLSTSVPRATAV